MSFYKAESLWMICLNCEHEHAYEEVYLEGDEKSECPFCGSHEFRQCDSLGYDLDEYIIKEQYND